MRHIHPAAWAGLLLNCMLTLVLFSGLNELSSSDMPRMEEPILKALEGLRPIMALLLGLQAVSLGLIASKFKAGIVLAVVGSFFMLPASLIYLIGCLLSHYRSKYAAFQSTTTLSKTGASFPSASAARLPYLTAGGFALCAFCFTAGLTDLGIIFLGLGLTGIYLSMRARKFHALSLQQSCFIVTPGLMADPLSIPYSSVRDATLSEDESIRFTIDIQKGQPVVLSWSLRRVEKNSRRAALENLGAALAAHYVPLY